MNSKRLVSISFSVVIASGLFASNAHAQNPDVSLMPIAADEPIAPRGFPPLPDKLDLPLAQTTRPATYRPQDNKLHGGYRHEPTAVYRQEAPSADAAFSQQDNAPARQQEQPQQRQQQPQPQRRFDQYGVIPSNHEPAAEVPKPVTVDQSHTQDLAPPDGTPDYSGGHAPRRDGAKQQLQDQFIKKPMQTIKARLFGAF